MNETILLENNIKYFLKSINLFKTKNREEVCQKNYIFSDISAIGNMMKTVDALRDLLTFLEKIKIQNKDYGNTLNTINNIVLKAINNENNIAKSLENIIIIKCYVDCFETSICYKNNNILIIANNNNAFITIIANNAEIEIVIEAKNTNIFKYLNLKDKKIVLVNNKNSKNNDLYELLEKYYHDSDEYVFINKFFK